MAAGFENFSPEEKSSMIELLNKFYGNLVNKKII
jgi:hypothetical protein